MNKLDELNKIKEKIKKIETDGRKPIKIILGYKRFDSLGLNEYKGIKIVRNENIFNLGIIVSVKSEKEKSEKSKA